MDSQWWTRAASIRAASAEISYDPCMTGVPVAVLSLMAEDFQ